MAQRLVLAPVTLIPLLLLGLAGPALGAPSADRAGAEPEVTAPPCAPGLEGPQSLRTVDVGGWTLRMDLGAGSWRLTPPGGATAVISGPGTCVNEGGEARSTLRVASGEPFSVRGFGAWRLSMTGDRSSMDWTPVAGTPPTFSEAGGGAHLTWDALGGGSITLHFEPYGAQDLKVSVSSVGTGATSGEISLTCGAGEGFFGLGSQVTGLDLKGRTYPLWTQEQGIGKQERGGLWPLNNTVEAAYAPMGVLHSSAGYSAILTSDRFSEVDLCDESLSRVRIRTAGEMTGFVLAAGLEPKARMTSLTEYIGRMTEPPPWVYAPWNDAVGGPERLFEVAGILRENGIPSSAIWSEDWIGNTRTPFGFGLSYDWDWDPAVYPDLPDDIEELHRQGFAFLAYFNPFTPRGETNWEEGLAGDYLLHTEGGDVYTFADPFFRVTSMVDLTNPDALAWLRSYLLVASMDLGIDGWMADFAEWLPEDAVMASGEIGWEAHNRFPLDWQRAHREAMTFAHASGPEAANNWVFFSRSGWASVNGGSGGAAPTMWGGDQNTNWSYQDGYPTVLPIGANLGMSGVGIFGSDIAGYTTVVSPPTTKELFMRWATLGAFSPLMRTHHGLGECDNWTFDRDEETLQHFRRYARIHALLYPTLSALGAESVATGVPILRHPYLVEPESPGLWRGSDYLFFLGDDLLVAPVLYEGADGRTVELPAPGWWPLFGAGPALGDRPGDGGVWIVTATADPREIPVYVRPGAALILLGEAVDSFYGASAQGVSDLADTAGFYRIPLYPDSGGAIVPTTSGSLGVSASGLITLNVDWRSATVNGNPVAVCGAATQGTCAASDGQTLQVSGTGGTIQVGGARILLAAPAGSRVILGLGGAAWGDLTEVTPLTDLNPDIPPPCHDE